jgi:hypothetical protein
MELNTRDSGSMGSEMAMEHKCGLMEAGMKDIGVMIRLMGKENWFMLMEMFMKGNGLTTKPTAKAHIHTQMVHFITEIG